MDDGPCSRARSREQIRKLRSHKPNVKIVSSVTGKWLSDEEEATSAEYWAKHLRETVRFSSAAETILAGDYPLVVEIGPGQTLATLIKQHKRGSNQNGSFSFSPCPTK